MRILRPALISACAFTLVVGCASTRSTRSASPPSTAAATQATGTSADAAQAKAVTGVITTAMAERHLKAVIVRVTARGKNILTRAFGESMTGVPATTAMHFRNGAVAISYVSTLLLELVDEKKVSLDDKLSKWLPEIPHADQVTLGELAQMTSGYADYVQSPVFIAAAYARPFRNWKPQELYAYGTSQPLFYKPGTNWDYAHTNYVILGLALERITGQNMTALLREKVLGPLGLNDTADPATAAIQEPALHAFSSERRRALKIPADVPFYEESSYWNPSWTITHGAIQTTNIYDLDKTAIAIGTGKLLSKASYNAMVSTRLRGRTSAVPGCPTCFKQSVGYTYGLGLVISGHWLLQNPLFGGYAAVEAYLPSRKLAVSVAMTYGPGVFDAQGDSKNEADLLFRKIGAQLAPTDAPPMPPGSN